MNKAITEGLVLMPRPFAAGLVHWSSGDGLAGDPSWNGAANAALVENDQDFGTCLEIQKTASTMRLRAFDETPLRPEMYLRLRARVKVISGNLPSVRVGLWAGTASGAAVTSVPLQGPSLAITAHGDLVEISAVFGPGNRPGVDLPWGQVPKIAHVGLDFTGANGGIIRIEDLVVEDITVAFLHDMFDAVNVRDYGAMGDGSSDDLAAFQAADAAALGGRIIHVPAGSYRLGGNLTLASPIRFVGEVVQDAGYRLVLTRNFDLLSYGAAFGSPLEGLKRAIRAMFQFNDHLGFDMGGRRVDLDAPLDIAALAGITSHATRRVLKNGTLTAQNTAAFTPHVVTSTATYTPASQPLRLTSVANVAEIELGSLVEGTGVGREIYVRARNVSAGWIELSEPLWGAAGTQSYTFRRFRYMLDFSGFSGLSRFELQEIEFNALGNASCVMLPLGGSVNRFEGCTFNRPAQRAITSAGTGCQGVHVDHCQFLSNEQALNAQDRVTIALNVNANDAKLRNNRIVRFRHFAVLNGASHLILGNHFFQGDDQSAGIRQAGIIFTQTNVCTVMSGNYIDNCFIEWGNEHDAAPGFSNELSFGGLSQTGNVFIASEVTPAFRWLVIKPWGAGHYINGFNVIGNSFRAVNATIERVEMVDDTLAGLDLTRSRDLRIEANSFHQVTRSIANPLTLVHAQNTAADTWNIDPGGALPFAGRVRLCEGAMPEGAITTAGNASRFVQPHAVVGTGPGGTQMQLRWGEAVKGKAVVRLRMDVPV